MEYVVGQDVVMVTEFSRVPEPHFVDVKISKIGTKWCYFEWHRKTYRFDPVRRWVQTGNSPEPRIYASRDDYQQQRARDRAYERLRQLMASPYECPATVSMQDIHNAARLVGFDLVGFIT